jgi:transposase-like protein
MGYNRVIKRVRLSDRKFSLVIRCFATDIPATDCARIAKVNRKTAQRYYSKFRTLIVAYQDKQREQFLAEDEAEADESYFGPNRVRGKRGRGAGRKIAVVGLLERDGKVFTKQVDQCTKDELLPPIRQKVQSGADIYTDGWRSYDALAAYGFNHKQIKHENDSFSDGDGSHINGIESFWSFAKRRLSQFNGVPKDRFDVHLRETEWRFNHRGDVEKVLRRLIREDRQN